MSVAPYIPHLTCNPVVCFDLSLLQKNVTMKCNAYLDILKNYVSHQDGEFSHFVDTEQSDNSPFSK